MSTNRVMGSIWFLVVSLAQVAVGQVVVELVPDNPGPYAGGEAITVDVWLHSSLPGDDPRLAMIQFDFSQTAPSLTLAPTFSFDFSSIPDASGYVQRHPELPVPWTWNTLECGNCPYLFLPLPPGGVLHIGSVGLLLPTAPGVYRLDALNPANQAPDVGIAGGIIFLYLSNQLLTAFSGQITGGVFDFVVGPPPIPTVSGAALLILAALLGTAGSWITVRRSRCGAHGFVHSKAGVLVHSSRAMTRAVPGSINIPVVVATLVLLGIIRGALAQQPPVPSQTVVLNVDSGFVSATQGTEPHVVFSHVVRVQRAPWIRLHFGDVRLSGSPSAANESFLRITSEADGAVQVLDSSALAYWRNTSAYFNGEAVLIELLGRAETGANRLLLQDADAGIQGELDAPAAICEPTDDRVPSSDPRSARIMPASCSGFLFNQRPNCLLTAGHCAFSGPLEVVEFNVPLSNPDGTINHPPPQDQYPVDPSSIQFTYIRGGQDWCQFGAFNNTSTGHSPLKAQGASYNLADIVPAADGSTLRITGYGADDRPPGSTGFWNEHSQTQQTGTGPYQRKVGLLITYLVDTMGGSSGSAVEHVASGLVYAIHINAGCTPLYGGENEGIAIDHPALQSAIACPIGVCADCNGNGILDQCDLNCASPCGGCNVPGCGRSSDCNSNGVPDECEADTGACCLSDSPNDCVMVPTSACCDALNGLWWYGVHSKCETTDCSMVPLRPQQGP